MKTRLILVRHGQSEGNLDHQVYIDKPDPEVELTNLGREQAVEAGKNLKAIFKAMEASNDPRAFWDVQANEEITQKLPMEVNVYYSPYTRAADTFELAYEQFANLEGIKFSVQEEPLIREHEYYQDPASLKDVRVEIQKMNKKGKFFHRFPGGESYADVDQRIFSFLHFLRLKDRETTVLFCHGNAIEATLRRILNIPLSKFPELDPPTNGGIIVVDNLSTINEELSTATALVESIKKTM